MSDTTGTNIVREDPPGKAHGRYSRITPEQVEQIAATLAAHPGEWFRVHTIPHVETAGRQATYFARDIKRGSFSALQGVEAVAKTVNGEGIVWARIPTSETQKPPRATPEEIAAHVKAAGGTPAQVLEFAYGQTAAGPDALQRLALDQIEHLSRLAANCLESMVACSKRGDWESAHTYAKAALGNLDGLDYWRKEIAR